MKYVLVVGGVLSGIGKGVCASSVGMLLRASGLRVTAIKIDPYLNIDAGTMSPFEHGEVFVLDDGGEVDLDLGNYERWMGVRLTRDNNLTTGKVYQQVLERERRGDYLGKTVQVVPHVTDSIQHWIEQVAQVPVDNGTGPPDVCVIELGGTLGDIESMPFIEALRQFAYKVGPDNFCTALVSLVPVLAAGEQKTKPTQHCVKEMRGLGMVPDVILCRSSRLVDEETRRKLGLFCQVPADAVLSVHDVSNLYRVPLLLLEQGLGMILARKLRLPVTLDRTSPLVLQWSPGSNMDWRMYAERVDTLSDPVTIAIVGKYTGFQDSYQSVVRALQHAAVAVGRRLVLSWVDSSNLEPNTRSESADAYDAAWTALRTADGILVPGGFGDRGHLGKLATCQYARTERKPFLGVCLGMQMAVLEVARNVVGLPTANSTEFDSSTAHPVVEYMPEISRTVMGGTMRLGLRRTTLKTEDCLTYRLYGRQSQHDERHRHRYEVNPAYIARLEEAGLRFVGHDDSLQRMEVVELPRSAHPFFVGHQAHPEFRSRPGAPAPLFLGLLLAASGQLEQWLQDH